MDKTNYDNNCRKQQTSLEEDNSESESNLSGHSRKEIKPKEKAKYELLERILDKDNMNLAYKRVKANKGAAGIDGITTEELLDHLKENKEKILGQIRVRKYKPKPVKR
ncbi:MAG: group II intron reverse transcriptase/maturase, partial [Tissierellia bacterium]|nr:group II intron reverse transcriptase/maturase [Tissierellia bacterium]